MSSCIGNIETKQEILNQLKVLASTVQKNSNDEHKLGLINGLSGELLFLWRAYLYDEKLIDEELFAQKLEFLQENVAKIAPAFSLESGHAGIGWFLEYINQEQGEEYAPEYCEDIDEILLNVLGVNPWQGEIEMLQGLAGMSIYGSRRQLKSDQTLFYQKLISHFERLATQIDDNALSWAQPAYSIYRLDKNERDVSEYNLGFAHGIVGIIASIIPAVKITSLKSRAECLLKQSCDWLLQQEMSQKNKKSFFSSVAKDGRYSRLGWCYGDLAIALTLARVGKALAIPAYIEKAKKISLHAAERNAVDGMVDDAGICHGSAGIALIFQLLKNELQLKELASAIENWLNFTLKLYKEKGLEGYYRYSGFEKEYVENKGLLTGYSGIGLCLLALLEGHTDWTDCLLLS